MAKGHFSDARHLAAWRTGLNAVDRMEIRLADYEAAADARAKRIAELEKQLASSQRVAAEDWVNTAKRMAELETQVAYLKEEITHHLYTKQDIDRLREVASGLNVA